MTDSYPLRWPDGWRRTPSQNRSRGDAFRTNGFGESRVGKSILPTFSTGRDDVLEELRKLGATKGTIVISSNVPVNQDGSVKSNTNPNRQIDDPGVAVYFSRKGRTFIIAQDAYLTLGVNLRSLALALGAMRTLERHGGGTMAGKAFDGFSALPPPANVKPKRPWWKVLRFPDNAEDRDLLSPAEIKARFKTLAKKYHPDAGGNDDEMAELNIACDEAIAEIEGISEHG